MLVTVTTAFLMGCFNILLFIWSQLGALRTFASPIWFLTSSGVLYYIVVVYCLALSPYGVGLNSFFLVGKHIIWTLVQSELLLKTIRKCFTSLPRAFAILLSGSCSVLCARFFCSVFSSISCFIPSVISWHLPFFPYLSLLVFSGTFVDSPMNRSSTVRPVLSVLSLFVIIDKFPVLPSIFLRNLFHWVFLILCSCGSVSE